MKTLTRNLKTRTRRAKVSPAPRQAETGGIPEISTGIRDILEMRVGCWRPPVHVVLS